MAKEFDTPLFEQTDHIIIRLCSMLDQINSIFESNTNALRRFYMRRDKVAVGMCFIADCTNHFRWHFQFTHGSDGRNTA